MAFKDIRLLFIIPESCQDETETTVAMQDAYASCKQNVMKTSWVREQDGDSIDFHKTDFIVFQEFAGELYEKILKTKSVILGPWCLISCLSEARPIPNVNWPLLNMAMYGCVITSSNLRTEQKRRVKFKIEAMGGHFMSSLVEGNTHLVTDSVQSEKYHTAAPLGVKIMLPSWVDAVWEESQSGLVKLDSPHFASHICPPFYNLAISITGFTCLKDRENMERLINENGGNYSRELNIRHTQVLVCNSGNSDKYRAAIKKKINCVTADWIYESVKAGISLPIDRYEVKKATSTPTKLEGHVDPNFSMFSMIGNSSFAAKSVLQETVQNDVTMNGINNVTMDGMPSISMRRKSPLRTCDLIEALDVKKAKKAGPFLDGCSIYLCGFPSNQLEKLHKMLNFSGATRYDILSERITHVIVGDKSADELKLIRSKNLQCALVSVAWIFDSMAQQQPISEEKYFISEANSPKTTDPGSPSVKKGLRLLKADVSLMEVEHTITTPLEPPSERPDENDDEIMRQYLQAPSVTNEEDTLAALIAANQFNPEPTPNKSQGEFSAASITMSLYEAPSFFAKLQFAVLNFPEETFKRINGIITDFGGNVVSSDYKGILDYVIVPVINENPIVQMTGEIVTDYWLTDCYQQRKKEIEYYHRPIMVANETIFEGMVITLSGFQALEKSFLRELCNAMGAIVQDYLSRTVKASKHVLASTHLISKENFGKKFEAAAKWGLPILRKEWILDCARIGSHQNLAEYLIGGKENSSKSIVQRSNKKISKLSLISNNVMSPSTFNSTQLTPNPKITPVSLFKENVAKQNGTPDFKIPQGCNTPQNQNLSNVFSQITPVQQIMSDAGLSDAFTTPKQVRNLAESEAALVTPKPWDYVKTPDTPYGECFVDPPPPELRKEFVRWMNKFPDFKPREECLSTPLSELKRRLWKQICDKSFSEVCKKIDMDILDNDLNPNTLGVEALQTTPTKLINETETDTPENKLVSEKLMHLESVLMASGGSRRSSRKLEPLMPQDKHHDKESQVFSVGWDDNMDTGNLEEEIPKKMPVFMTSGLQSDERDCLVERLESLGATVSDLANYDPTSTHLICPKLNRNEKLLASMAAGKWVLDVAYVEASVAAGKLLDEEEYEFGNPKSSSRIKIDTDIEQRAKCAHYWRKEITRRGYGAFHDVRAIVVASKREPIIRVIEAGGGMVVNASPPFENDIYATHCFLETKSIQNFKDYIPLAQQGVICVNTLYINEFLHQNVNDYKDFLMPSFSKYYN